MNQRDLPQERYEDTHRYFAWLRRHVPKTYLVQEETSQCYSPTDDFQVISDLGFDQKRENLERAYQAISDKLIHAVGSQKSQGCERCVRLINARVLYHVRHHQELFTEGAHKLVWMELEQRNKEHREEGKKGYYSDGLFFIKVMVPYRPFGMQATHLVFYHERSARQGVRRLMERAEQHPHMLKEYPCLKQLLHFSGDEREFRFPEINHDYFSISSHEFANQNGVLTDTFVDVVARNK